MPPRVLCMEMKAAAGVILVTTKTRNRGQTAINYKGSLTFSHATTLPKFMNGTHYMQWYNYARRMDGEKAYFTDEEIAMTTNGDPTDGFENTDWQEPIYRTTLMHQHNLSISGGNEKTRYFLSGGFMKQNGFIKGFELERGNFRSNIDTQVTKDISVSLNVAGKINELLYSQVATVMRIKRRIMWWGIAYGRSVCSTRI